MWVFKWGNRRAGGYSLEVPIQQQPCLPRLASVLSPSFSSSKPRLFQYLSLVLCLPQLSPNWAQPISPALNASLSSLCCWTFLLQHHCFPFPRPWLQLIHLPGARLVLALPFQCIQGPGAVGMHTWREWDAPPSLGTGKIMIWALPSQGMMRISELMPIKYYNYSMESSDGAMRNWASGSNLLRAGEFRQKQQPQKFFLFVPTIHPMQSSISKQRLTLTREI